MANTSEKPLTMNIREAGPMRIEEYESAGGYSALRKALSMKPEEVLQAVIDSNLRGRGGAGFPTGMKWKFVPRGPGSPKPKYFCVNADEMEPGTFKDRMLMEHDPHSLVEGSLICAYAIEASEIFIFVRWAYELAAARIEKAVSEARAKGYIGKNVLGSGFDIEVHMHVSSGRYMCGEEGALLNAIEGKRPTPRTKPPFPQACGLWGKPTVVNNVETVCNIRHIVANGAAWFNKLGIGDDSGTKLYGVSGKVKRPGLWELPIGTSAREIIETHAGGMREGIKLKGFMPGGASTDFLVGEHLDLKMDFGTMEKAGSRLGTGTIIVLDDQTCPVGMVLNLLAFFSRESCGWCTPCREGLPWITRTLEAIENGEGETGDLEILQEHTKLLGFGNTFCALAPGAVEPLQSALKYFREDFERHIVERLCPWGNSGRNIR